MSAQVVPNTPSPRFDTYWYFVGVPDGAVQLSAACAAPPSALTPVGAAKRSASPISSHPTPRPSPPALTARSLNRYATPPVSPVTVYSSSSAESSPMSFHDP